MLKNKFGMLKVVALALTVLMLATLVACNKGMDDAAIQDAINNAVQSQSDAAAAEQSKLAASMSEAQAKADAEAKAAQESLAAAQAEAQKKIEEAEKLAAEASKAAAEAEKKAAEEASKAAESAAKAAEQAKKDAEEASKALESMQSSIAQSSKDAVTATTAPNADADAIAAINAKFQSLKYDYLLENSYKYLAAELKELNLTFEKAAVELTNAMTKDAAESIYAALEVAVAAIENVENRSVAVQALIADLGDVETKVFTTEVEKIVAAEKAYTDLTKAYKTAAQKEVIAEIVDDEDLTKARKKLDTLSDYIKASLAKDIQILVIADRKGTYDPEDMMTKTISITDNAVVGTVNTNFGAVIDNAYYSYRVLSYINGGDLAAADAPIDWEDLVKDGKVVEAAATAKHPITGKGIDNVLDLTKATAYYSVEDLVNNYIRPTLDYRFELYQETLVQDLEDRLYGNETKEITGAIDTLYAYGVGIIEGETDADKFDAIIDKDDIDEIFELAVEEFEAKMAEITFTDDYKADVIYTEAQKDLAKEFAAAYVDAVMEVIETSKAFALETYTEKIYDELVDDAKEHFVAEEDAGKLESAIAGFTTKLNAYSAKVEAAAIYDYAGITAKDVLKVFKADAATFFTGYTVNEAFYSYVNAVAQKSINNFSVVDKNTQTGVLGQVTADMVADLEAFRAAFTTEGGANYDTLAKKVNATTSESEWAGNTTTDAKYERADVVAALDAKIVAAIEAIQALDPVSYSDKEVNITWHDNKDAGDSLKKAKMYFKEAEAKRVFEEEKQYTEAQVTAKIAKDYFTATNTGLPYTFTFTAEEQAVEAAEKLYVQAWKDIYVDVVTMMGYKAEYEKMIDNNDGDLKDSDYEKALNSAAGNDALVAEIKAFGAIYTAKVGANLVADKYANALDSALTDFFAQKTEINTTHTTIKYGNADVADVTANFDLQNIKDVLADAIKPANDRAADLITLYADKFAAVEKVAVAVGKAMYTYTTVNGVVTATGTPTYNYSNASALAAEKYEAAISAFIAEAEAKIMAVTMSEGTTVAVTDWAGNPEIAKDIVLDNYAAAIDYVNAIVDYYVGSEDAVKVIDGEEFNYADSAIFQQYKIIIKNNYNAYDKLADPVVETPEVAE